MARPWGIDCDRTFDCSHCGAKYAVDYRRLAGGANGAVCCEVCFEKMSAWNPAAHRLSLTLIERPGPND